MSAELIGLQKAFLASMRGEFENNAGTDPLMPALALAHHATPEIGLAIYQNAYAARLREVLENDHPQLGKYLGDELWQQLCAGYIELYPSKVRSLRDFGAALPNYLATAEPFIDLPIPTELAIFERLLLDCFDAADAPLATWQSLLATPAEQWPNLRPQFHPSARLHRARWNSVEIWRALKAGSAHSEPTPPEPTPPEPHRRSAEWLLWRNSAQITRFRSLSPDEMQAYAHFCAGGNFAGLCEALQERHAPEAVPGVALGMLQSWCAEDLICAWNA